MLHMVPMLDSDHEHSQCHHKMRIMQSQHSFAHSQSVWKMIAMPKGSIHKVLTTL